MRREYKMHYAMLKGVQGLPLHAQGIPIARKQQIKAAGITPACTGNTFFLSFFCNVRWDYPCMRREYQMTQTAMHPQIGLPLHAQGILRMNNFLNTATGITPACAGNTLLIFLSFMSVRDYPCMRREYLTASNCLNDPEGLPLHAQGILSLSSCRHASDGITPACAGNTTEFDYEATKSWDYPCMRREYDAHYCLDKIDTGLPLHAQGIPGITCRKALECGITPACAGNT